MRHIKTNRSLFAYIFLSIITCGIYQLFFIHSLAEDVNELCKEDGKETTGVLGFILFNILTCGIYAIVWWYKLAERLHDTGVRKNVDTQVSGSTFLLWFLLGACLCGIGSFYALYLVFRATNLLAAEHNRRAYN